ncbi:thioredoxin family protein [Paludifilum halophilum]|nr:thioredoxin family protein [Paludifilum halophilum]
MVPNGIFIDEDGIIRMAEERFRVDHPDHTEAVRALALGDKRSRILDERASETPDESALLKQLLADTKMKLAQKYVDEQKTEKALQELDEALRLDPDNFVIRKQRWYLRYPERFNPTIDFEWQREQLNREKKAEAALSQDSVCGPDDCIIPASTMNQERDEQG